MCITSKVKIRKSNIKWNYHGGLWISTEMGCRNALYSSVIFIISVKAETSEVQSEAHSSKESSPAKSDHQLKKMSLAKPKIQLTSPVSPGFEKDFPPAEQAPQVHDQLLSVLSELTGFCQSYLNLLLKWARIFFHL